MKIYKNSPNTVKISMQNDPKGLQGKLNNLQPGQKLKLSDKRIGGINWSTIPNQNNRNCIIASKFGNMRKANPIFMGFIDTDTRVIKSSVYDNTPITNREVYLMRDGNYYLNMVFTFSQRCKLKLDNGKPIRLPLNIKGSIINTPLTSQTQAQDPINFVNQDTKYLDFTQNEQYYIFEIYNGGNASGAGKKVKKPTTKKPNTKKTTTKKPSTKKVVPKKSVKKVLNTKAKSK